MVHRHLLSLHWARNPRGAWHFPSPGRPSRSQGMVGARGQGLFHKLAACMEGQERRMKEAAAPDRQVESAGNLHTDLYARPVDLRVCPPNPEGYMEVRAQSQHRLMVSVPLCSLKATSLKTAPTVGPVGRRHIQAQGTGEGLPTAPGPAHRSTGGHAHRVFEFI